MDVIVLNVVMVVMVVGSYIGIFGFRDSIVGSAALLNKSVFILYVSGLIYVVVD